MCADAACMYIYGCTSLLLFTLNVYSDEPDRTEEIASLPEQCRYGINCIETALKPLVAKGLKTVLIFGVPTKIEKVTTIYHP